MDNDFNPIDPDSRNAVARRIVEVTDQTKASFPNSSNRLPRSTGAAMTDKIDNDSGMQCPKCRRIRPDRHSRHRLGPPMSRRHRPLQGENRRPRMERRQRRRLRSLRSHRHRPRFRSREPDRTRERKRSPRQTRPDSPVAIRRSQRRGLRRTSSEIVDLITDLLHLAARMDQGDDPVESTLRLARMHFDAERSEQGSDP